MYLVRLVEKKTGRTLLNYYEKRTIKGKTKAYFVERIGYLDEFEDLYEDPIAHFRQEAKKRTKESKITLELSLSERYSFEESSTVKVDNISVNDRVVNYGMLVLSYLYHKLDIHYFINNRRRYTKAAFNHNHIFQLLVYARILFPESKLGTWRKRENLIGEMDFSEDDVYRSLSFFSDHKKALISHLHKKVGELYGRDTTLMYYDVTNYYWETDEEDDLRKRGYCKSNSKHPIVQMGLLMDKEGLPVSYSLFEGNTNDTLTLSPMMGQVYEEFEDSSVIYVADKAMMSGENRAEVIINRGGYVFSQSVRGPSIDSSTRKWLLNQDDYKVLKGGKYKYKSRLQPVSIVITDRSTNKKKRVTINEVQVAYWSHKYQQRSRHNRNRAIENALQYGSVLNNHGANKYFAKEVFDSKSNEKVEKAELSRYLDHTKIALDESLDGYYMICSNVVGLKEGEKPFRGSSRFGDDNLLQLNKSVDALDLVEMYRGLWKIEESFKITKSQLRARPAYVRKEDSVEAHFLTCFVALLILRLLEKLLGNTVGVSQIVNSLRQANLVEISPDLFSSSYCDTVIQKMAKTFKLDLTRKNYMKLALRELVAATKK